MIQRLLAVAGQRSGLLSLTSQTNAPHARSAPAAHITRRRLLSKQRAGKQLARHESVMSAVSCNEICVAAASESIRRAGN